MRLSEVAMDYRTTDWTPTGKPIALDVPAAGSPDSIELLQYDPTNGDVAWPGLLEAAFAEVDQTWSSARREAIPERGYPRLDAGATIWEAAEMLAQLTGNRAGIIDLDRTPAGTARNELMLQYLLAMLRPVLIETRPATDAERRPSHGMYPGHVYEITHIHNGQVDLHNPWGVLHPADVPLSLVVEASSGLVVTVKD